MSEDLLNEISAINSIYGEDAISPSTCSTSVNGSTFILCIPNRNVSLHLRFPPSYPQDEPPDFIGIGTAGEGAKKGYGQYVLELIRNILQETYTPGQVCLFDVLETLEDRLQAGEKVDEMESTEEIGESTELNRDLEQSSKPDPQATSPANTSEPPSSAVTSSHNHNHHTSHDSSPTSSFKPPEWTLSAPLTVKKSVFLARATPTSSRAHAEACIAHLLATDKRAEKATHNISAYRIDVTAASASSHSQASTTTIRAGKHAVGGTQAGSGRKGDQALAPTTRYEEDYDDDGETAAGGRLLKQLQLMDASNVLVVVSRWYGGVKLGPARFAVICGVARDAVASLGSGNGVGKGSTSENGGKGGD